MKSLAILQMVCGLLIAIVSWYLAGLKAHTQIIQPADGSIIVNAPPPGATEEFILLGFSIATVICGLFQYRAHIKGANFQIILGLIMTAIYIFLSVRAATLGYGERSTLYYLAYLTMALGMMVFIIGVAQIITRIKKSLEVKQ